MLTREGVKNVVAEYVCKGVELPFRGIDFSTNHNPYPSEAFLLTLFKINYGGDGVLYLH